MFSLIKIEWLKIKKYPAFWWMFGIVALTYPGTNLLIYFLYDNTTGGKESLGQMAKFLLGNPFSFPETWHSVAYFSSWFILLPSILVIMLITNEYNYKTNRQNIIDGWSKTQFITSKLIDVAIVSLVATVMYVFIAIIFGFSIDYNSYTSFTEQTQYIPLFFLQTFAQLSIAFLLGFLIKKAFIALGVFLFYYIVVENAILGIFRWQHITIGKFLPFSVSNRLIPPPAFFKKFGKSAAEMYQEFLDAIPYHIGYTLILTGLIWFICFRVNEKRDL